MERYSFSGGKQKQIKQKNTLLYCTKKLDGWASPVLGSWLTCDRWCMILLKPKSLLTACWMLFYLFFLFCTNSFWVLFPANCCASIQQNNYILWGLTLKFYDTFPCGGTSSQEEARFLMHCDGNQIFWTFSFMYKATGGTGIFVVGLQPPGQGPFCF